MIDIPMDDYLKAIICLPLCGYYCQCWSKEERLCGVLEEVKNLICSGMRRGMNEELKQEIDNMSYARMLQLVRVEPLGSKYFHGEVGDYFEQVMQKRREEVGFYWSGDEDEEG